MSPRGRPEGHDSPGAARAAAFDSLRRVTPSRLVVCALAFLAAGCSEPAPDAAPAPALPPVAAVEPALETPVPDATPAPPLDATPLAPDATALPDALPAAAAPQTATAENHLPLESLLLPPGSGPPAKKQAPLDLSKASAKGEPLPVPPPYGGIERWKDRLRLERRSDPIGRPGAKQGTYSETEAGVRLPVDDAVSLEGGVRVDSRSEPGGDEPQRQSIPRVGVEVKF